jgi:hypothetical protein
MVGATVGVGVGRAAAMGIAVLALHPAVRARAPEFSALGLDREQADARDIESPEKGANRVGLVDDGVSVRRRVVPGDVVGDV